MRKRTIAVITAAVGLAAILGGSLGLVAAGTRSPLSAGFNITGGPLGADVQPAEFVACLPASSWNAIYIWDAQAQTWKHHFNTNGTGVPQYVNQTAVGGILVIPRLSGVILLMNQSVAAPRLKDTNAEACS
jgi:hypothetical protein